LGPIDPKKGFQKSSKPPKLGDEFVPLKTEFCTNLELKELEVHALNKNVFVKKLITLFALGWN